MTYPSGVRKLREPNYKALQKRRNEPVYQMAKADGWYEYANSNLVYWLLAFNLLGAIAHGVGVVLTFTRGRTNLALGVYQIIPHNIGNATHPDLVARMEEVYRLHPTTVVAIFFGLSLGFHIVISLLLMAQIALPQSPFTTWYMRCLYYCIGPWRWSEYALSASTMLLLTCLLLGLRELHVIYMVTGLMAITILFGWLTELHSSSLIEAGVEPYEFCGMTLTRRWVRGSWKTRFQMHLMGYVPYALLWGIVFDRFRINMEVVSEAVPEFVNTATIGSFVLFTLFGFVQLFNQLFSYGPSLYWLGECTYVVLSFAAKANLGFIVLFQALVPGGPYDSALGAKFD
jgi:hypothetical protein